MMRSLWLQRSCFILMILMSTLSVKASYQIRELETAGTLLYLSFDNASSTGYWQGQTPLTQHQAQITSGARGNGCIAPQLDIRLAGNINPKQGTLAFFTKLPDNDQPLMQMLTANGQCMIQIGKVGTWLRPWILLPSGKAIGREADTRLLAKDQWAHLALVWDQQKGIRFYINGKLASHQWGAFHYVDTRTPATMKLYTQRGIDELWIFDHPMDISQINALRQGKLIRASILAQTFPKPRKFAPSETSHVPRTFAPYSGQIPQWAQSLRQLLIETQQLTHTLNPIAFEPQRPLPLVQGHDALCKKKQTRTPQMQRLTRLWQWYTNPSLKKTTTPNWLPTPNFNQATQSLLNVQNGKRFDINVTLNLLAVFGQEGAQRFLDAALTNALADPTQCLKTLGIISCQGQFVEPMFPDPQQLAVTWKQMGTDVIARVNRVSESSLHVTLFNFNKQPRIITMRLWSLVAGQYQVMMGPDANDDDMVDSITLLSQWPALRRGSEYRITLPGGQTVLELIQIQASDQPPLAQSDPALHRQWVYFDSQKDELSIRVVNLGMVPANDVTVEIYADGELLRQQHISQIPASTRTLGRITIRYPMISTLKATDFQVRLHCCEPEQSNKNNEIAFSLHPN